MMRDGGAARHINAYGARLRETFNAVISRLGVAARVYGDGSHAHFFLAPWPFASDDVPVGRHGELAGDPQAARLLRLALFNEGLDFDFANNISAIHGEVELELAVAGFERALRAMLEDRVLSTAR
jgi:glutamate-1-semialdehyde aminotransferase